MTDDVLTQLPAAVLFDIDGTLVDTEPLWARAVAEVCADFGYALSPDDTPEVLGQPSTHTAAHLLPQLGPKAAVLGVAGLARSYESRFAEFVSEGATVRPGVPELLVALAAAQIPAMIVSASSRHVISLVRDALGAHLFVGVVGLEDTVHSKPAPDPYLAAAERLGVAITDCLIVEDSPVGVAAAEATGAPVLVVPSHTEFTAAPGRHIRYSLAGVSLTDLACWHAELSTSLLELT